MAKGTPKPSEKPGPRCEQCGGTGRTVIRWGGKYGQYEKCEGCGGSGKAW